MQPRRTLVVALLAVAALAAGAPGAHASPSQGTSTAGIPWLGGLGNPVGAAGVGMSGCGTSHGSQGQGGTGSNEHTVCGAAGPVFVGPSSAVTNVIGPTVISPGFAGVIIVSGGNSAAGP
jgi:hypothetical protein